MTEAAQVYHEDVRQRSNVKKSAGNKKNGSNTMKLGNKPMSWQEIAAKHGECKTYDLEKFMNFQEFEIMPEDLQVEYVNKLQDKYDIGIRHISQELFKTGVEGLRSHLRDHDLLKLCNPDKKRAKSGLKQFKDDIAEYEKRSKLADVIDLVVERETKENGPVFITYEEYCRMKPEERVNYVNGIIDKWNVSKDAVCKILFEKSLSTLNMYFRNHGLIEQIHKVDVKGPYLIRKQNVAFQKAVDAWKAGTPMTDILPAAEKIEEPVPDVNLLEKTEKEPALTTLPALEDYLDYHDSSFHTSYIRTGLDMNELFGLAAYFQDKRVRVNLEICVI